MIYFIKIAFNRSKVSSYVKKKLYDPFLGMAFNCRKVRSTWIRAEGGCTRVWETVQNTFKGRGTEKRIGKTKILKKGQAGSRGGCLKRGV